MSKIPLLLLVVLAVASLSAAQSLHAPSWVILPLALVTGGLGLWLLIVSFKRSKR